MRTLQGLSVSLKWQLHPVLLIALLMAFYSRLGRHSLLASINMDTFLLITRSLLDAKQEKKWFPFSRRECKSAATIRKSVRGEEFCLFVIYYSVPNRLLNKNEK